MKRVLLAAAMFTAPILVVVAANPDASVVAAKDAYRWA